MGRLENRSIKRSSNFILQPSRHQLVKTIALVIAGLFIHFSGFGQKGLFIGMYVNDSNFDTSVRVFMSYDSVKVVSTKRIRNNDMWLQLKCGTWAIKSYNPDGGSYTITFLFNNGTAEDVMFKPSYPTQSSTLPTCYRLYIDYVDFGKVFGKGSVMERDIFDLKTIYGK